MDGVSPVTTPRRLPFLLSLLLALVALPQGAWAQISEAALRAHIDWLADDARLGRATGGPTERDVTGYIAGTFAQAGLKPGWKGQWLQPVHVISRQQRDAALTVRLADGGTQSAGSDELLLLGDRRGFARLGATPLLYLGDVDQAMGSRRDDLSGKAVIVRLNDPSADQSAAFARICGMLAQRGVRAVIAAPRSVSWFALTQRIRNGLWDLDDRPIAPFEGALSPAAAERVLAAMGAEHDAPATVRGFARTEVERRASHNVIARIPGSDPAAGAVVLLAHWDHIGLCRRTGDRICNGAVDNASGVAALMEIGRALVHGPQPRRDILLLASTAEELGLLGSRAFAKDSPVPIGSVVAGFNLDSIAIAPRDAPLAVVGRGQTRLDPYIAQVARATGRTIGDTPGADIYFTRQDGYSLIEAGVPAVMITSSFADDRWLGPYIEQHYHQPSDDPADVVELGGAAQDADFHVALARFFADPAKYPAPHH